MKKLTGKFLSIALFVLFLQYIFVIYTSPAFLYVDDILVVFLVPAFIVFAFKTPELFLFFYLFILLGFLLFIIHPHDGNAMLDCITFCKPVIFFYGLYYLFYQIKYKQLGKIFNFVVFLFKIVLIYGILQWIVYFLFRTELPMLNVAHVPGAENFLKGEKFAVRRVNSIFGFHLWFAYLCASFGGYFFYRKIYVWALLCFVGIFCAFSRFGIGLFVLSVAIILLQKKDTKSVVTFLAACVPCVLIGTLIYWKNIVSLYDMFWGDYNEVAIKMQTIRKGITLFFENPFGYGFGSFGTKYSTGSSLNGDLNFAERTSGGESTYFILLVQVGLLGLVSYLFPFAYHFYTHKRSRYLMGLILLFPLVSTFYNPIYLSLTSLIVVWSERRVVKSPFVVFNHTKSNQS